MHRTYTNETVVAIGVLLLTAALVFAWIGSQEPPASEADEVVQPIGEGPGELFDWEAIGARTYQASCASCHREGEATRRVPPLIGHVPRIFLAEGGRKYLIDFVLFGLEGPIEVDGKTYDSRHPIYNDRLSDEEVAGMLNHILVRWGNLERLPAGAPFYTPSEVAERRPLKYNRADMLQVRERILSNP